MTFIFIKDVLCVQEKSVLSQFYRGVIKTSHLHNWKPHLSGPGVHNGSYIKFILHHLRDRQFFNKYNLKISLYIWLLSNVRYFKFNVSMHLLKCSIYLIESQSEFGKYYYILHTLANILKVSKCYNVGRERWAIECTTDLDDIEVEWYTQRNGNSSRMNTRTSAKVVHSCFISALPNL